MADINLGVGGANSASDAAYEVDNSLKLEEGATEYLYYTPSSQTDYERMTFSIWIKRTELTGSGNPTRLAEFGNGTANTGGGGGDDNANGGSGVVMIRYKFQ